MLNVHVQCRNVCKRIIGHSESCLLISIWEALGLLSTWSSEVRPAPSLAVKWARRGLFWWFRCLERWLSCCLVDGWRWGGWRCEAWLDQPDQLSCGGRQGCMLRCSAGFTVVVLFGSTTFLISTVMEVTLATHLLLPGIVIEYRVHNCLKVSTCLVLPPMTRFLCITRVYPNAETVHESTSMSLMWLQCVCVKKV